MIAAYFIVFSASLILTMVGLGGGLIFSPAFVLLGMGQAQAAGASLLLNGLAALSASVIYLRRGMVDMNIALPLIVTSTLFAPLGALATQYLPLQAFTAVMAVILLLAALRMSLVKEVSPVERSASPARRTLISALLGMVIGFLGGLLGIGGGVFIVPLLIYLLGADTKVAAASSMFIVCFSSFSGFVTHAALAELDWGFIAFAAVLSIIGGQIGSRVMTQKLRGRSIRLLFSLVLFGLSCRLLYHALAG
jgi:uncharacterized protein